MANKAIIDIGSNSVRIRISADGNVLLRDSVTTQLSKDAKNGKLSYKSINRTFKGLDKLISEAKKYNAEIYPFATAAVRNSENGKAFCSDFYNRYGLNVDVLSGERESEAGIIGAIGDEDGLVIDVGGASSEIAVRKNGKTVYAHSIPIGAVVLSDITNKNLHAAKAIVDEKIKEYGIVPEVSRKRVFLIGGTATSLSFMLYGDKVYDREKNHGRTIITAELEKLTEILYSLSPSEIMNRYYLQRKRASIIHSGALIVLSVLRYIGADSATVSENDNLEGYYNYVIGGNY